jgi:hypothetical protein
MGSEDLRCLPHSIYLPSPINTQLALESRVMGIDYGISVNLYTAREYLFTVMLQDHVLLAKDSQANLSEIYQERGRRISTPDCNSRSHRAIKIFLVCTARSLRSRARETPLASEMWARGVCPRTEEQELRRSTWIGMAATCCCSSMSPARDALPGAGGIAGSGHCRCRAWCFRFAWCRFRSHTSGRGRHAAGCCRRRWSREQIGIPGIWAGVPPAKFRGAYCGAAAHLRLRLSESAVVCASPFF